MTHILGNFLIFVPLAVVVHHLKNAAVLLIIQAHFCEHLFCFSVEKTCSYNEQTYKVCCVCALCFFFLGDQFEFDWNKMITKYLVLSGLYVFRQGTNGQILPISASHLAAAKKGFRLRLKSVPKKAAPRYWKPTQWSWNCNPCLRIWILKQ